MVVQREICDPTLVTRIMAGIQSKYTLGIAFDSIAHFINITALHIVQNICYGGCFNCHLKYHDNSYVHVPRQLVESFHYQNHK